MASEDVRTFTSLFSALVSRFPPTLETWRDSIADLQVSTLIHLQKHKEEHDIGNVFRLLFFNNPTPVWYSLACKPLPFDAQLKITFTVRTNQNVLKNLFQSRTMSQTKLLWLESCPYFFKNPLFYRPVAVPLPLSPISQTSILISDYPKTLDCV